MAEEDSCGPDSAPPEKQAMDEEFRFLLCEGCHQEVGCPKLLPCLHNICTECLQETKPLDRCPVCSGPCSQTDGTPVQDNLFFANLQAKLSIFQMIKSGQDLICDNCKKEGTYWCSDCKEFLCISCFETHQRYLKKESHEARAVKDLRADSSKEFLTEFKNISVMFCPNAEHKTQNLSIYCKACARSMCCICAVLDSQHNGHHCHIREEIERRQHELQNVSTELKEKKVCYDKTCSNLRELVSNMVEVKNETRKLIQEKVAEMIRLVHEKGEELLAAVDEKHHCQVEDVEEKLKNVEHMAQRMASCELLVEKIHLYASDQEVMDMYPFIRESLEELKRKQPPAVETQIEVGNFAEVETQLQAFYGRVIKEEEAAPAIVKIASNQEPLGKSPAKRKGEQMGNAIQPTIKVVKIESDDDEWKLSAKQVDLEQPGTSFGGHPAGNEGSLWKGEDTEVVFEPVLLICSSQSCKTNVPSLNNCPEDESSDGVEYGDFSLQEDTRSENSQDEFLRSVFSQPKELFSGHGTLVFFDLKVLRGSSTWSLSWMKPASSRS
ncbi:protein PML-like isoform X2 [Eublepharis macularius]|uniref:Protein PML-like isoform X2 n=1 Tax=Eublepharis macularius TaxID=481883 RepID=A0AA97KMD7_EUBMA|nr:protein PML-like isoform X2 [Eublepharis macularius]